MNSPVATSNAQRPAARPTRQRLIEAAVRLFAERGYEGTPVGAIESAAGLVPRSGGLYKHFASKRELLEAALAERMSAIEEIERRLALLPLEDVASELTLIARLALEELEHERELAKIVMKEGDRFPGIAASFHERVVERGHELGRAWLAARVDALAEPPADLEATSQVLVDALVGFMLQRFMFGEGRVAIERERVVAAWVEIGLRLLQPAGAATAPRAAALTTHQEEGEYE